MSPEPKRETRGPARPTRRASAAGNASAARTGETRQKSGATAVIARVRAGNGSGTHAGSGAGVVGRAAPIFAALGDPTRLELVAKLCMTGPMSITKLADGSGVTRQAVTKHLRVLEEVGLAKGVRAGRDRVWEIEPRKLDDARSWLSHIEGQWDDALARLKARLEK